jgi:hypothetical protein
MEKTDMIALIAAIAAGFSAAIALAAFIVALFARKDSRRSADAAQRATELMAEELKLTVSELNRQQQKEITESRPIFIWKGGMATGEKFERQFENVGGEVYDLSVQTLNSDVSPFVHPDRYIGRNSIGSIVFNGQRSLPISFIIKCKTKLEEKFEKKFALTKDGIVEA